MTIGPVAGSHPRPLVNTSLEAHKSHLNTLDIEGAQSGTKGLGPFAFKPRSTLRNSIDVADIEGAQMESLKRAPVTKRCTNPVSPIYQYPGHSEEQPPTVVQAKAEPVTDRHFRENQAQFFGETPSVAAASPKVSPAQSARVDASAEADRAKFYADESRLQSPGLKAALMERDKARFYSNTPPFGRPPGFEEVFRPGSLHLAKPRYPPDNDPIGFQRSAKTFYGVSPSISRGSIASSKVPPQSPSSSDSKYKFTLPRGEIGAVGSRHSSLRSSAKQIVETS